MYLNDLIPEGQPQEPRTKEASLLPGRDEIGDDIHWGSTGAIDYVLQGRRIEGSENSILQALTDRAREVHALQLPVKAGTRVRLAENVGVVLAYEDLPDSGVEGSVILVRSPSGDVTASQRGVHVLWDDGKLRAIRAEHLRLAGGNQKRAGMVRMSFVDFGGIADVFGLSKEGSSDLVHKATKDLWSFRQEDGEYVIERLFNDEGQPLRV